MSKQHNADHYYLDAAERDYLARHLDNVRDMIAEMAIILTAGQTPTQSLGITRPQPGSREPYNLHIKVCLDELTNALTTTIRHVCEEHDWPIPAIGQAPATQASWIIRNMMTLAATEGAKDFYDDLIDAIGKCENATTREDKYVETDPAHEQQVARMVMTASQIEGIRHKLGPDAAGLTKRRVNHLARVYRIPHTVAPSGEHFYVVADVLTCNTEALTKRRA